MPWQPAPECVGRTPRQSSRRGHQRWGGGGQLDPSHTRERRTQVSEAPFESGQWWTVGISVRTAQRLWGHPPTFGARPWFPTSKTCNHSEVLPRKASSWGKENNQPTNKTKPQKLTLGHSEARGPFLLNILHEFLSDNELPPPPSPSKSS